ncbi:MAG TPA: DpnII family type II restriction endonuclease [Longimicrobium sp.]|nr:DpnII family type II restriction endonuclease [Longimicrobium sp.]
METAGRPLVLGELRDLLRQYPSFLVIARLFLGVSQDRAASTFSQALGMRLSWPGLRARARQDPEMVARAMVTLGLPDTMWEELRRTWTVADVLNERYRLLRGRAIAGQQRGRQLEDRVRVILERAGVPFEYSVTFVGREGQTAKCDFAIPSRDRPKIVIEAKGFEATGSKVTDALGDILKIERARTMHMYFFVVLDGTGWHHRPNDLRNIVRAQNAGRIDMIYTTSRLDELEGEVARIYAQEFGGPAA